jgi:branched-chain amino acid transport system permease protein
MVLYGFLLNALLTGIASILLGLPAQGRVDDGTALTLAAAAAAVLGGFGLRRAIVAALLLGVVEQVLAVLVAAPYRAAILPAALIAAVAIRPEGLFRRSREQAA